MFFKLDDIFINEYLKRDYLLPLILEQQKVIPKKVAETRQFRNMINHSWKRAMHAVVFGGLKKKSILDIGGAYAGDYDLTHNNDYTLLDPDKTFLQMGCKQVRDYYQNFKPKKTYDYVTACDVFLSDGHDLGKLAEIYLPICKELRLSLTFRYSDQDEYFGYTLDGLNAWMTKYGYEQGRNKEYDPADNRIDYEQVDYLPNNRNVYIISLKGDLWKK